MENSIVKATAAKDLFNQNQQNLQAGCKQAGNPQSFINKIGSSGLTLLNSSTNLFGCINNLFGCSNNSASSFGGISYFFLPKLSLMYSEFKYIAETDYYQIFEALSVTHNEKHTIRVLNLDSLFYKQDPSRASSLFIQELLRLCITSPKSVSIEAFEINGNQIAYAIKHSEALQQLLGRKSTLNNMNLEKMLKDVSADISFLRKALKLSSRINIELKSINHISSTDSYFLGDWSKNILKTDTKYSPIHDFERPISNGAEEAYSLGLLVLELHGICKKYLKEFESLDDLHIYNEALTEMLSFLKLPEEFESKIKRMLTKDPRMRIKLEELEHSFHSQILPKIVNPFSFGSDDRKDINLGQVIANARAENINSKSLFSNSDLGSFSNLNKENERAQNTQNAAERISKVEEQKDSVEKNPARKEGHYSKLFEDTQIDVFKQIAQSDKNQESSNAKQMQLNSLFKCGAEDKTSFLSFSVIDRNILPNTNFNALSQAPSQIRLSDLLKTNETAEKPLVSGIIDNKSSGVWESKTDTSISNNSAERSNLIELPPLTFGDVSWLFSQKEERKSEMPTNRLPDDLTLSLTDEARVILNFDVNEISHQTSGTLNPTFIKTLSKHGGYVATINAMPHYSGKSLDELRTQEYMLIKNFNGLPDNMKQQLQSRDQQLQLSEQKLQSNEQDSQLDVQQKNLACRDLEARWQDFRGSYSHCI